MNSAPISQSTVGCLYNEITHTHRDFMVLLLQPEAISPRISDFSRLPND